MGIVRLNAKTYSDAVYVAGVFSHDPVMERALYKHCKNYFYENYTGVFFVGIEYREEIFQEAFIKLWENIIDKKIYVEDGELRGRNGAPLSGRLTTYFMSIARLKYLEWARHNLRNSHSEDENLGLSVHEEELYASLFYGRDDEIMLEIIADCISRMPERCSQILTMFYYEEKTLDRIMTELPTFGSKNALKTAKYKCMENLRSSAKAIYHRHLNS